MSGMRKWAPLALVIVVVLVGVLIAVPGIIRDRAPEPPAYPTQPVTVIVPFSAGGMTDRMARGVQPIIEEKLGQPLVVTNMPGAAGSVGATHVDRQAHDGYTLLFGTQTMSLWQVQGLADLSPKSFEPIMVVAQGLPVVTVNAASPWQTIQQFVAHVRANPGAVRLGTAGPVATGAIMSAVFSGAEGTQFTPVVFDGGGPAVTALLGGHIEVVMENLPDVVEHHKAGKLRILGIFDNVPHPGIPGVPALGAVFPALRPHLPIGPYLGLFAPKDTPPEVLGILREAVSAAADDPRWSQFLADAMFLEVGLTEAAAVEFIDEWTRDVTWLLYDLGALPNSPEKFGIPRP